MTQQQTPVPKNVRIVPEGIAITWPDGHHSLYPHRFLRLRCACATCVGEWPHAKRLDESTVPEDVQALDSMPIGSYALQFLWSDLHSTGIYPYNVLREACPCPECAGKRSDQPRPLR
ncbi:MAG: DUF971 domain-containing protein [Dehalococcoidia bacterium]|nr:DUF971 domain-containing protein [Dehalococcoidia bacterium]